MFLSGWSGAGREKRLGSGEGSTETESLGSAWPLRGCAEIPPNSNSFGSGLKHSEYPVVVVDLVTGDFMHWSESALVLQTKSATLLGRLKSGSASSRIPLAT